MPGGGANASRRSKGRRLPAEGSLRPPPRRVPPPIFPRLAPTFFARRFCTFAKPSHFLASWKRQEASEPERRRRGKRQEPRRERSGGGGGGSTPRGLILRHPSHCCVLPRNPFAAGAEEARKGGESPRAAWRSHVRRGRASQALRSQAKSCETSSAGLTLASSEYRASAAGIAYRGATAAAASRPPPSQGNPKCGPEDAKRAQRAPQRSAAPGALLSPVSPLVGCHLRALPATGPKLSSGCAIWAPGFGSLPCWCLCSTGLGGRGGPSIPREDSRLP